MTMTTTTPLHFIVSCDHVAPAWRRENMPATVKIASQGEGKADRYYVSLPGFGCSRSYASPRDAIVGMLQEHACYDIKIVPQDADTVIDAEHEATVADVKSHREARAIRYVLVAGNYVYAAYGERAKAISAAKRIAATWGEARRLITLVDTWGQHPLYRLVGGAPAVTDAAIHDANLVATVVQPVETLDNDSERLATEENTGRMEWWRLAVVAFERHGLKAPTFGPVCDAYSAGWSVADFVAYELAAQ